MAVLLRFRPRTTTERLYLPDGSTRKVKVTVNDAHTTQHVEDGDHVHGTGRPPALRVSFRQPSRQRAYGGLLRNVGMPKMRQAFAADIVPGLWAPVPGTEQLHGR